MQRNRSLFSQTPNLSSVHMRGSDTTRSGEAAAVDTIAGCRIIADEFLFHDHSSACSTDYKGAIDRYKSDKFYQVTTRAE
jgi:hypothetical protein